MKLVSSYHTMDIACVDKSPKQHEERSRVATGSIDKFDPSCQEIGWQWCDGEELLRVADFMASR